jgi:hypothetical protein
VPVALTRLWVKRGNAAANIDRTKELAAAALEECMV